MVYKIGRITTVGVLTQFPVPSAGGLYTNYIASGPDGNLWFTGGSGTVSRITTAGVITQFAVPTSNSAPQGIALGPDGNLWFAEVFANHIGRAALSPSGAASVPALSGCALAFCAAMLLALGLWSLRVRPHEEV